MRRKAAVLFAVGLMFALFVSSAGAAAPNWDVSGIWTGVSGLAGTLIYPFEMTLSQTGSAVAGTIDYPSHGIFGATILGSVDGDDFYFTRSGPGTYKATCEPCTIAPGGLSFHGLGFDPRSVEWDATGSASPTVVTVLIDIKPGSYPNSVNPDANGVIPVAILTTATFDASTVDPETVALEGNSALGKGKSGNFGSLKDVDGDGDLDLVVQVTNGESWDTTATSATLTGQTWGDTQIQGSDSISFVP